MLAALCRRIREVEYKRNFKELLAFANATKPLTLGKVLTQLCEHRSATQRSIFTASTDLRPAFTVSSDLVGGQNVTA